MQKTSQNKKEWKRHKKVTVPWATYDTHRLNECKRVIDLRKLFSELDRPVHRREFKLSQLTVLLLLKLMFGISYRTLASATRFTVISGARYETSAVLQNYSEHYAISH